MGVLMRKLVAISLVFVFMICFSGIASFAASSMKDITYKNANVTIDGVNQSFHQSAVVTSEGNTFVPMRAIFEKLGATVKWDQNTKTATAAKGKTVVKLTIGKTTATVNGKSVTLTAAAITLNGNTMVPLRFIAEALGATIGWENATQTAIITSAEKLIQEKLEAYFNKEGSVEELFTMGYPDRIYWEDSSDLRKLPRRSYDFWMEDITYASAEEAIVSAGYRSETQALKSSVETKFTLQREDDTWKISDREWVHFTFDLPADADETAGRISSENANETQKLISDLKKHYEAMNGRKLEAAMATLSSYFIEEWERMTYTESTYRDFLQELFEGGYADRNELLDARVLYLGDSHAVIHARVLFSMTTELQGEESHEYDLLIDMDRTADGRWTYYDEWDLDGDY